MFLKNMNRVNVNIFSWVAFVLSAEPSWPFSLKLLSLISCEYVFFRTAAVPAAQSPPFIMQ